MLVVRVTDSAEGWLAARYHLAYVPTLVFWRGAVERSRIKGNAGAAAIRAHLEFLLTGEHPPDPAEGPAPHADGPLRRPGPGATAPRSPVPAGGFGASC